MDLKNKTVLVTGSSSGIGKAIAIECAKNGATVLICYRKNRNGAEEVLKEVKRLGGGGDCFQSDLAKDMGAKKLFLSITKKGYEVDVLVNNAGESQSGKLDDYDKWLSQFENIFFSAVRTTNEYLNGKKSKKLGKIINISSVYGMAEMGNPNLPQYCAAKAAMNSFTINLAKKLAPGILVNAIVPGYTTTPPWEDTCKKDLDDCANLNKIKRFVKPDEIATMVVEVLKNDAITGELIRVDGGLHLFDIL